MKYTNVVYDKETGRVILYESNGKWTIPEGCKLAHFENGVEPILEEDKDGRLYLVPNAILVTDY